MKVHIIPIFDGPISEFHQSECLAPGEIGEFVVRGPVVTKSYFRRDDATRLAKMHDPATGEILQRMGDVGFFDLQGRLWYCGRKGHRVMTASGTLFTEQVEEIFNAVAPSKRTALVGVKIGSKIEPVICYQQWSKPEYCPELPMKLRDQALAFSSTAQITRFLNYPRTFPVDPRHNAKINRETLAVWAAEQLRKTKA